MEPLWCWKCGAHDSDCSCGHPSEDTPKEEYKFCEVCGNECAAGEYCEECGC